MFALKIAPDENTKVAITENKTAIQITITLETNSSGLFIISQKIKVLKTNPKHNLVLTRNISTPVRSLVHSGVVSGSECYYYTLCHLYSWGGVKRLLTSTTSSNMDRIITITIIDLLQTTGIG